MKRGRVFANTLWDVGFPVGLLGEKPNPRSGFGGSSLALSSAGLKDSSPSEPVGHLCCGSGQIREENHHEQFKEVHKHEGEVIVHSGSRADHPSLLIREILEGEGTKHNTSRGRQ